MIFRLNRKIGAAIRRIVYTFLITLVYVCDVRSLAMDECETKKHQGKASVLVFVVLTHELPLIDIFATGFCANKTRKKKHSTELK